MSLFVVQDSTGSVGLPYKQVLYSPYPSTHIDVDINTVKQMPPCHEHLYHQHRYMQAELSKLWKTISEDDISPENINIQDSFTPDLYGFFRSQAALVYKSKIPECLWSSKSLLAEQQFL